MITLSLTSLKNPLLSMTEMRLARIMARAKHRN